MKFHTHPLFNIYNRAITYMYQNSNTDAFILVFKYSTPNKKYKNQPLVSISKDLSPINSY